MTLPRLQKKKRLVVLGLNSGTSADGLDLAALMVDRSRGSYHVKYLAGGSRRYPAEVRDLVLKVADATMLSAEDLIFLDQVLGQFFGRAAATFIKRLERLPCFDHPSVHFVNVDRIELVRSLVTIT